MYVNVHMMNDVICPHSHVYVHSMHDRCECAQVATYVSLCECTHVCVHVCIADAGG